MVKTTNQINIFGRHWLNHFPQAQRPQVWLEFTLGSLRAECLLLADTMLVRMVLGRWIVWGR